MVYVFYADMHDDRGGLRRFTDTSTAITWVTTRMEEKEDFGEKVSREDYTIIEGREVLK